MVVIKYNRVEKQWYLLKRDTDAYEQGLKMCIFTPIDVNDPLQDDITDQPFFIEGDCIYFMVKGE